MANYAPELLVGEQEFRSATMLGRTGLAEPVGFGA